MAKLKLSAQALKQEQEALRRYERFLPTLELKKLQLQVEQSQRRELLEETEAQEEELLEELEKWQALLGAEDGLAQWLEVEKLVVEKANVAGVELSRFEALEFKPPVYDLFATPWYTDRAVRDLSQLLELRVHLLLLRQEMETLGRALQVTLQRINLFEKVKIPEARDNIRRIRIFLGDQQTAAVVRGKIAKAKLARKAAAGHGSGAHP